MDPALLGFLTIGTFLVLVFTVRAPVLIWLVLVPIVAALAGGFGGDLGGKRDGGRAVHGTS